MCNLVGVFVQDFGLDVEAFQQMVGDCPPDFLELAIACCNVRNAHLAHSRMLSPLVYDIFILCFFYCSLLCCRVTCAH